MSAAADALPRPVRPEEVERAREVVGRHLAPTPLRPAFACKGDVLLKLECWQPTGSFKVRGALNTLSSLSDEDARAGVVAASAGNHALGVAFAVRALGGTLRATLFVPRSAPRAKVDKLRRFPVVVIQEGEDYDQAHALALAHAERTGRRYVHAFDEPATAAGQGTVGLEVLEQRPDIRTLVVPVGGGGLMAGCAVAIKARAPHVRVVAVQPEASPSLAESLRVGRPLLEFAAAPTLADSLAGGIGEIVFAHRGLIDEVVAVKESDIEQAVVALLAQDQVVAEGAGAVGVAALRSGALRLDGGEPAAVVVSGGNIDAAVLARLLARHLPA